MNVLPDNIDFAAYMADTESKQKVKPAKAWVSELVDGLTARRAQRRVVLPWQKSHEIFEFRPGEVTLWAGINGHGKSLVTGQVALSLIAQGEKVCIASFEMKPIRTLERMVRQWSGQAPHGEAIRDSDFLAAVKDVYEQFGIFTDKRLWMYDQQGTVKPQTLLGVIRYCGNELGVRHVFIDNLAKCVRGADDYSAQKDFVDELCAAARDWGLHIHLVHHIKKLSSETDVPNKFDVKGAGEIADQVDNLLLVWRNKKKEKDAQVGKKTAPDEPDALVICDKQRNGEWEGRIGLFFDAFSQQFVANPGASPLDFMTFPHAG